MLIDVAQTPVVDVYHALVGLVNPRPIAWVTTINSAGIVNLAPFSFFNAFGANPPVVVFSPTLKRDGSKKDTLRNLEALGEFVVNISVASMKEIINETSREVPPEESELELAKLHALPSLHVKPPRVAEAPAALECRVMQIIPVGNGPISANLVIGEVLAMHIHDDVLGDDGRPDAKKLQTVARLGGEYWCHTSDLFVLPRP